MAVPSQGSHCDAVLPPPAAFLLLWTEELPECLSGVSSQSWGDAWGLGCESEAAREKHRTSPWETLGAYVMTRTLSEAWAASTGT